MKNEIPYRVYLNLNRVGSPCVSWVGGSCGFLTGSLVVEETKKMKTWFKKQVCRIIGHKFPWTPKEFSTIEEAITRMTVESPCQRCGYTRQITDHGIIPYKVWKAIVDEV